MATKKRAEELNKNVKRLFWVRFLVNTKLVYALISLFFEARGLTKQEIFLAFAVGTLTVFLMEVPSSYAADHWGRKKTILLATILLSVQSLVYSVAHGFWPIVVGVVCNGLAVAIMSGTFEAMSVDSLHEMGANDDRVADELAQLSSAFHWPKAISYPVVVLGAWVFATYFVEDHVFYTFALFDAAGALTAWWLASKLIEPDYQRDLEGDIPLSPIPAMRVIIGGAVHTYRSNPVLLRIMINTQLIFTPLLVVMLTNHQYFEDLGFTKVSLGVGGALYGTVVAVTQKNTKRLMTLMAVRNIVNVLNKISLLSLTVWTCLAWNHTSPMGQYVCFIVACISVICRFPYVTALNNRHFNGYNRATCNSFASLVSNFARVGFLVGMSFLAAAHFEWILLIVVFCCACAVIFFPLRAQDEASPLA